MASRHDFDDVESERAEGQILIRRFTDQLEGANELEISTIAAQTRRDEEIEAEERARMKKLYSELPGTNSPNLDYDSAEVARVALASVCEKYDKEIKPSKLARFGINRTSAKKKANEAMQNPALTSFDELNNLVSGLGEKWQSEHGPIYRNFHRLCKTLDAHKSIFKIFPSQNMYASVLCGSLSLLVNAAVTHNDIAETLAQSIAEISDKAALCSQFLLFIKTASMRQKLADVYAHVFIFYRKAMEWYLQSRTSTFFGSFNTNVKKSLEKAVKSIINIIDDMSLEAQTRGLAMLSTVSRDVSDIKSTVGRDVSDIKEFLLSQRQNHYPDDTEAGRRMYDMFMACMAKFNSQGPLDYAISQGGSAMNFEAPARFQELTSSQVHISRANARDYANHLEAFVVGEEGPGLFKDGWFWMAESNVFPRLQEWMAESDQSRVLWISSPYEQGTTSAKAAALAVVGTAWQAKTPIISHFCERPRRDPQRLPQTVEQNGLIGVVYSLIIQLLQFNIEGEEIDLKEETFKNLNGDVDSWSESLEILSMLLFQTPFLSYCVIHGLNELEWSNGDEWCHDFLEVLFRRQEQENSVFNILLTTSGQSKVLPNHIGLEDCYVSNTSAREVARVARLIEF